MTVQKDYNEIVTCDDIVKLISSRWGKKSLFFCSVQLWFIETLPIGTLQTIHPRSLALLRNEWNFKKMFSCSLFVLFFIIGNGLVLWLHMLDMSRYITLQKHHVLMCTQLFFFPMWWGIDAGIEITTNGFSMHFPGCWGWWAGSLMGKLNILRN